MGVSNPDPQVSLIALLSCAALQFFSSSCLAAVVFLIALKILNFLFASVAYCSAKLYYDPFKEIILCKEMVLSMLELIVLKGETAFWLVFRGQMRTGF